ncbi:MAG TPA: MlaD family protein [Solirubrobacteraceae bacterium]|nr:MlaD family protein [Solirubrobacteraceae bacterium]
MAVAAVVVLLLSGSPYTVRLLFSDASGLVTGDQVMIGPSNVGSVQSIGLSGSGQAVIVISLNGDAAPLYRGTVARIEENGLAGIASHYITLQPATARGAQIPSGGTIPESDTHAEVSLDQLFDTLDPLTQKGLRNIIRGEATSIKGKSAAANATLHYLAPVLQSTSNVTAELSRYEPSFDQLLVRGAQTMQALASRSEQLTSLVDETDQATGAIASQAQALETALGLLPGTLTKSTSTFAGLRQTLTDLTPLVNAAKPAVVQLPQFARALDDFGTTAVPTLQALADLVQSPSGNGLVKLLQEAPKLERVAATGFPDIIASLEAQESSGQLAALRDYTPDIIAALTNIGQDGGYYDANGHYDRSEPFYGAYGITAGGDLTDTLPDDARNGGQPDRYGGLTLVKSGRCPGGATQPADASMSSPASSAAKACSTANAPGS